MRVAPAMKAACTTIPCWCFGHGRVRNGIRMSGEEFAPLLRYMRQRI